MPARASAANKLYRQGQDSESYGHRRQTPPNNALPEKCFSILQQNNDRQAAGKKLNEFGRARDCQALHEEKKDSETQKIL